MPQSSRFHACAAVCLAGVVLATAAAAQPRTVSNPSPLTPTPADALTNAPFSDIVVAGVPGRIMSIQVTVAGITFSRGHNLSLVLVGPGGRVVPLFRWAGQLPPVIDSPELNNVTWTFIEDQPVGNELPMTPGMPTGAYAPTEYAAPNRDQVPPNILPARPWIPSLGLFRGALANGTYRLYAWSTRSLEGGQIAGGWSITMTTSEASADNDIPKVTNPPGLASGPATNYPNPITVSGLQGTITSASITLHGLSHVNPDDIDVLLVSPTGLEIMLMSDAGGTPDIAGVTLTFVSSFILPPIADAPASAVTSGTYVPTDYGAAEDLPSPAPPGPYAGTIAQLVGTNPNGTWSLYVRDDNALAGAGSLLGWSLDLRTGGELSITNGLGQLSVISEGVVTARFLAYRTGGDATAASATLSSTGSSATLGVDFGPVAASVALGAGVATQVISVPVANDTESELLNENIEIRLTVPVNTVLGDFAAAMQIADNDAGVYLLQPPVGPTTGGTKVQAVLLGAQNGYTLTLGGNAVTQIDEESWATQEIVNPYLNLLLAIYRNVGLRLATLVSPPSATAGPANLTLLNPNATTYTAVNAFIYVPVATQQTTDTDGDGLPDYWEQQFGLNQQVADGSSDPDEDGATNLEEFQQGTHPRGFYRRYLAEGASSTFFTTQLALLNRGDLPGITVWSFQRQGAALPSKFEIVPAKRRVTFNPGPYFAQPGTVEFSTLVESDQPIVLDRTISWDANGYGAHAETGLRSPSTTWYLAEGATHSGFSLFYLLQNPGDTTVTATIQYLRPAPAGPITKQYTLGPLSRTNVWVNLEDPGLASTDVSAVITTTAPVIVERAMYLDTGGQFFGAGHESAGVTNTSTRWTLAEGATGPFFDLFVLLANPSPTPANVQATYLRPDGSTLVKTYTVDGNSRRTIWVDYEDATLADTAVATTLEATNGVPFLVERALWWANSFSTWYEAHNSAGATETGPVWALAEGERGGPRGVETYILVANTSPFEVSADVTLYLEDGTSLTQTFDIPANARFNVAPGTPGVFESVANARFGAIVRGNAPIGEEAQLVVERAMYWNALGTTWAAGTNALGTLVPQ